MLSALGMLAADASPERSRTVNKCIKDCDEEVIQRVFIELTKLATVELMAGCHLEQRERSYVPEINTILTVDVRYHGQNNALNLQWQGFHNIEQVFHQKHEDSYGHQLDVNVE